MRQLLIVLTLWLGLSTGKGLAQDSLRFSLSDAIETAMTNNKSLQANALNQELNRYQQKEADSYLLPTLSGSVGISHFFDLPQSFLPASLLNPAAPDGQVVGVALGLPNTSQMGIDAQWMIFNKSVFTGNKLLEKQAELTGLQIRQKEEEVAYNVSMLYYAIVFSQMQARLVKENIGTLKGMYATVESNYTNGLIKKTDLDRVLINILNLNSQLENLETQIESQLAMLKLSMGISRSADLVLTDDYDQVTFDDLGMGLAPRMPTDLSLVLKRNEIINIQEQLEKDKYLPSLTFVYSFNYNWTSNDLGKLYGSSLNYPFQLASLKLSVPVFNGFRTNVKVSQARVNSQMAGLEAQFLDEKTQTDIQNASRQYAQFVSTVAVRRQNVAQAKQIYEQSVFQYREGTTPLSDLLNNELAVREAESQYLYAVSQTLSGLLSYKKAAGLIQTNY